MKTCCKSMINMHACVVKTTLCVKSNLSTHVYLICLCTGRFEVSFNLIAFKLLIQLMAKKSLIQMAQYTKALKI